MMKFIKRHILLYVLIFSFCETNLFAQDNYNVESFADSLYLNENYEAALLEYQRALFFSEGNNLFKLYRKSAQCNKADGAYMKAAGLYELAYFNAPSDSMRIEMVFEEASCYLHSRNYPHALMQMFSLPDTLNGFYMKRKYFFLGVTYFGMEYFDKAELNFLKCVDTVNVKLRDEIKSIFHNKKKIYKPSPRLASALSIVLPGLGQAYVGDWPNASNSFLLTGSFLVIGVGMAVKYSFIDAFVTVFPWFQRYYQGGYKKAGELAKQKREHNRIMAYKEIIRIIAKSKLPYKNQ